MEREALGKTADSMDLPNNPSPVCHVLCRSIMSVLTLRPPLSVMAMWGPHGWTLGAFVGKDPGQGVSASWPSGAERAKASPI